jgi:hypothetical protein
MLARIAPVLTALVLLSSCATTGPINVDTQYVPGKEAQLASFKTYAWSAQPAGTDPMLYPPGVEKNVKDAVNGILQARGYREVGLDEHPDFKLGWHAAVDTKLVQSNIDVHYGYYWGPYGLGASAPVIEEYDVGTLVLDVADGSTNELLWRGAANGHIERNVSADEKRERINAAATKILERFPPQP